MSEMFKLNVRDYIKGLAVSVISAILTVILNLLQNGSAIDWKSVGVVALTTGIAYLLKNVFTDSNQKIAGII
jgi:hypothetical protein